MNLAEITETRVGHDSINYIRENVNVQEIRFGCVTKEQVYDKLFKMNERKATSHEGILPKLIKMVAYEISYPITYIVNKAIKTSSFPNNLKCAQVSPVYKKGDPLDKANYRDR